MDRGLAEHASPFSVRLIRASARDTNLLILSRSLLIQNRRLFIKDKVFMRQIKACNTCRPLFFLIFKKKYLAVSEKVCNFVANKIN
jgi:hypothetical protein